MGDFRGRQLEAGPCTSRPPGCHLPRHPHVHAARGRGTWHVPMDWQLLKAPLGHACMHVGGVFLYKLAQACAVCWALAACSSGWHKEHTCAHTSGIWVCPHMVGVWLVLGRSPMYAHPMCDRKCARRHRRSCVHVAPPAAHVPTVSCMYPGVALPSHGTSQAETWALGRRCQAMPLPGLEDAVGSSPPEPQPSPTEPGPPVWGPKPPLPPLQPNSPWHPGWPAGYVGN